MRWFHRNNDGEEDENVDEDEEEERESSRKRISRIMGMRMSVTMRRRVLDLGSQNENYISEHQNWDEIQKPG